jgi:hypothetical protein
LRGFDGIDIGILNLNGTNLFMLDICQMSEDWGSSAHPSLLATFENIARRQYKDYVAEPWVDVVYDSNDDGVAGVQNGPSGGGAAAAAGGGSGFSLDPEPQARPKLRKLTYDLFRRAHWAYLTLRWQYESSAPGAGRNFTCASCGDMPRRLIVDGTSLGAFWCYSGGG